MLKIEKGKPWIMWPNNMVANFIDFPANQIFDYDGNFDFMLIFKLCTPIDVKSTLFAKLPTYFGIDLEKNGVTLIYCDIDKKPTYRYTTFNWEIDKKYRLNIKKTDDILGMYIDDLLVFQEMLPNKLGGDINSHIIFGAANFPKNGFNLNYLDVILETLHINKEGEHICSHNFDTEIHGKCYDHTNNCNFINQI